MGVIWQRRMQAWFPGGSRTGAVRLVSMLALASVVLNLDDLATAATVYRETSVRSPLSSSYWDAFGASAGFSGDTAIFSSTHGAHVFVRDGGSWSLQQTLSLPDQVYSGTVAISGETVVAGNGDFRVFAYARSGGTWGLQAELAPSTRIGGGWFGRALAIDGDTAVVGEPHRCVTVNSGCSGAVSVFVRSGGVWSLQQTIFGDTAEDGDEFGSAVAISGETVIVGSVRSTCSGRAYAYVRSEGVWSRQQELLIDRNTSCDPFGTAVAVAGDTAIIGSPGVSGAAFVYLRSAGIWTLQQRLPDPTMSWMYDGLFGQSVALSGDSAVVGSPWSPAGGSAFLFTRSGGKWTRRMTFSPSDQQKPDDFGSSVALSGNTVLATAKFASDSGQASGPGYFFTPVSGVELMTNGGMENDANRDKVPDGWLKKYWTALDGRTTKVKHRGTASVRLAGKGTRKSLRKTILRSGSKGDALVLSAHVKTSLTPANIAGTRIRLFVYNGTKLQTIREQYAGGGTHSFVKEALNYQATGPYTKLVVALDCWDYQGTAWFDTVSLARALR